MRYSVLGGALQISVPASRRPIWARAWLRQAAARSVALPPQWARRLASRRSVLVVLLGAAAIGAGVAARETRNRTNARTQATADSVTVVSSSIVPGAAREPGTAVPVAAESTLSSLAKPGYALSTSAARALEDVRAAVSDTALLQQLRAQILAPAPLPGLSAAALNDLVSLVRQAQVTSANAARAAQTPVDPVDLAQAETSVRAAQQELIEATRARDAARLPVTPAGIDAPAVSAAAGQRVVAAPAPTPADPALVRDAQARLREAQRLLQALLTVPPPEIIAAAQKALSDALADASAIPTDAQFADAKAAIDQAQKQYDAVLQGPSSDVVSAALAEANGRPTPAIASGRSVSAAPAAADPGTSPEDTLSRLVHGPDPQRLADTKANLDFAKASLAALEQRRVNAASPESQPAVIQARKTLASLTTPASPQSIADAQAVVTVAQHQLDALISSLTPASQTAASPNGGTAGEPAGRSAAAGAATAASAPQSLDSVAAAEQHLSDAQKRLRDLIVPNVPNSNSESALSAPSPPEGSTPTIVNPEIRAAERALTSGVGVSRNDLTALQLELRARYVLDAALRVAHLHPSAMQSPLATSLQRGTVIPSKALTWPVVGAITQPFGVPELGVGAPHTGVDIGVPIATPVLASASGLVTFAGGDPSTSYGYYAIVDHGGGVTTLYGHLALPPLVRPGQFLAQGGLIGLSGSTGFSTGPHVHFEVRLNGAAVDPLKVLAASGGR